MREPFLFFFFTANANIKYGIDILVVKNSTSAGSAHSADCREKQGDLLDLMVFCMILRPGTGIVMRPKYRPQLG